MHSYMPPIFLFPPQKNRVSRNLWITFFIVKDFWETLKDMAKLSSRLKVSWNILAAQNNLQMPGWITDDSITAER